MDIIWNSYFNTVRYVYNVFLIEFFYILLENDIKYIQCMHTLCANY